MVRVDKWNICSYARVVEKVQDITEMGMAKFVPLFREPMTDLECRQIQDAYFKGPEIQKSVIQRVFDDKVTYEFFSVRLKMKINQLNREPRSFRAPAGLDTWRSDVEMPPEAEMWDRLCRAAYHQVFWDNSEEFEHGEILSWAEQHFYKFWDPPRLSDELWCKKYKIPLRIPFSIFAKVNQYRTPTITLVLKIVGAAIVTAAVLVLNFFLTRLLERLFPL